MRLEHDVVLLADEGFAVIILSMVRTYLLQDQHLLGTGTRSSLSSLQGLVRRAKIWFCLWRPVAVLEPMAHRPHGLHPS